MRNRTVPGNVGNSNSNVICSCNCTGSQPRGMDISELEFVQIIIILVVMTVMVVVIICLLNHYRLSALSFLSRHSQAHQRERCDQATQLDGCLWQDSMVTLQGAPELLFGPQPHYGHSAFNAPSYLQQAEQRPCRFQPTFPYLQQEIIDLPPTICLSDGEELPPYHGPCALKLRDPEQQLELSRASVRAPPNRTVFDSDLANVYVGGRNPRPPSCNSGVSAANGRMEGPPPSYSEVMGHYPGSSAYYRQYSNNSPSPGRGLVTGGSQPALRTGSSSTESTTPPSGGRSRDSQQDKTA